MPDSKAKRVGLLFLLELKIVGWQARQFYNFICYNHEIYEEYLAVFPSGRSRQLIVNNYKSSKKLNKMKEEMQRNFNNSLPDVVFSQFVKQARRQSAFLAKQSLSSSITSQDELWRNYIEQLIKPRQANPLGFTETEIKEYANQLKKAYFSSKNVVKKLNGVYSNIVGELTERALQNHLDTIYNKQLKEDVIAKFESKLTGKYVYGGAGEVNGQIITVGKNKTKKTVYKGALEKFGKKNSFYLKGYAHNSIKIDLMADLQEKSENKPTTFTFGLKSHWTKGTTESSVQGSNQTLRKVISMYNFYNHGNKISNTKQAYWWYLNNLFYEGNNANIKDTTKALIYGSYFGNVDYEIDFIVQGDKAHLVVLSIDEILDKNNNALDQYIQTVNLQTPITLKQSNPYSDKDIPINESKLLDNIKFKSLEKIILSKLSKQK